MASPIGREWIAPAINRIGDDFKGKRGHYANRRVGGIRRCPGVIRRFGRAGAGEVALA